MRKGSEFEDIKRGQSWSGEIARRDGRLIGVGTLVPIVDRTSGRVKSFRLTITDARRGTVAR